MSRTNKEIMYDIRGCYIQMSPENLYQDGERTFSQAETESFKIRRKLKELFHELGRVVTESEALTFDFKK